MIQTGRSQSTGADVAFSYAPGKIILAGEHAVVYGCPAIALALDRGVRMAISTREDVDSEGPILRAAGLGFVGEVKPGLKGQGPEVLQRGLRRLIDLCGERVTRLEFMADCAIPGGRGLGSSAALSVAMVRGIYRYFEEEISEDAVVERAMELERIFHGNPSGIDHTVIAQGGCIWYERKENAKLIERVNCPRPLRFAVGLAGAHGGTSQMVLGLSERRRRHSRMYSHIFDGICQISLAMREALSEGHLATVGELMNINQGFLNALGVSTAELETLCAIARGRGALGAKLTGAGGGGAVIALVDGDAEPILHAFRSAGYMAFAVESGGGTALQH